MVVRLKSLSLSLRLCPLVKGYVRSISGVICLYLFWDIYPFLKVLGMLILV